MRESIRVLDLVANGAGLAGARVTGDFCNILPTSSLTGRPKVETRFRISNSDLRLPTWIGCQRATTFGAAPSEESNSLLPPNVKLGKPSQVNLDPKLASQVGHSITFFQFNQSADFFDPTRAGLEIPTDKRLQRGTMETIADRACSIGPRIFHIRSNGVSRLIDSKTVVKQTG